MKKNRLQKIIRIIIQSVALSVVISFLVAFPHMGHLNRESLQTAVSGNGKRPARNFLLLGTDESERLTDVIMLISLDSQANRVTIAQIPRDTYAEYTDAAYRKLNGAASSLGGGRAVADFIESSLGITIDNYITINLRALAETVDQLGGVEIVVPKDMVYEDEAQDLSINLKAGKQVLDGEKSMQFIRYRADYIRGDISRLDAQKIFLSAFFNKLATCKKTKLISVAKKLLANSESDVKVDDCIEIVTAAMKVKPSNILFITMPGADVRTDGGTWYYVINKNETSRILCEFFDGNFKPTEIDPERRFTGEYSKEFNAIYDAESGYECRIYTAESINSHGIEIDKIKN